MNAPFLLPVSWTDDDLGTLIDKSVELICSTRGATDAEKRYIELALNHHEELCELVQELIAPMARNSNLHNRATALLRRVGA